MLLASPALALDPLVPCGRTGQPACTTCDALVLGKNISDFILVYLVPSLAALLFIYAGFLILLGGGIPAQVDQGKKIFETTVKGLLIIFLAWMIVNTVLRTIAGDQNIAENWWKLECRESVVTASSPSPSPTVSTTLTPTPTTIPSTSVTPSESVVPTATPIPSESTAPSLEPSSTSTATPTPTPTPTPTISPTSLTCRFSGVNLCQGGSTCPTNACSQYSAAIQKAVAKISISGLNATALIRSFMFNESSCKVDSVNSIRDPVTGQVRESCGPMQMQTSTANNPAFKMACGLTAGITCNWLRDSANIDGIVCLGAQYIKSIAGGTCGSEVRNIAAGYNGGVGACAASRDCAGEKSCSNETVRKWECLYDNPQHTVCNTGIKSYDETRAYAPKVQACYNINK